MKSLPQSTKNLKIKTKTIYVEFLIRQIKLKIIHHEIDDEMKSFVEVRIYLFFYENSTYLIDIQRMLFYVISEEKKRTSEGGMFL